MGSGVDVQYLDAERFTFNRWLSLDGEGMNKGGLESTCHATCFGSETVPRVSLYCKIFRLDHNGICNLINEIMGYELARFYDLPVSPSAYVLNIPIQKLDLTSTPASASWLSHAFNESAEASCVAFATEDLKAPNSLVFFGQKQPTRLLEDLSRWPGLPSSIVFDDVITNHDRNLGNLIRKGRSDYVLIDHGRLISPCGTWQQTDLDPLRKSENKLFDLREHFRSLIPLTDNELIAAAEMFFTNKPSPGAKLSTLPILSALCGIHTDKPMPETLCDFFYRRAQNSDRIMHDRLKMLA